MPSLTPQQCALIALSVILAIAGIYDVFAIVLHGPGASLTHLVRDQAKQHPAIPFAAGLLLGHLFLT